MRRALSPIPRTVSAAVRIALLVFLSGCRPSVEGLIHDGRYSEACERAHDLYFATPSERRGSLDPSFAALDRITGERTDLRIAIEPMPETELARSHGGEALLSPQEEFYRVRIRVVALPPGMTVSLFDVMLSSQQGSSEGESVPFAGLDFSAGARWFPGIPAEPTIPPLPPPFEPRPTPQRFMGGGSCGFSTWVGGRCGPGLGPETQAEYRRRLREFEAEERERRTAADAARRAAVAEEPRIRAAHAARIAERSARIAEIDASLALRCVSADGTPVEPVDPTGHRPVLRLVEGMRCEWTAPLRSSTERVAPWVVVVRLGYEWPRCQWDYPASFPLEVQGRDRFLSVRQAMATERPLSTMRPPAAMERAF